jgi:hypothetical protein
LKRLLAAITLLACLSAVAVAQGEVVQQFSFQLDHIKRWGAYRVLFSSQSFERAGGIPAPLNENYIRLPRGAVVRKEFQNKRFYCDAEKLKNKVRYEKGQERFTPYLNKLLRGKKKPPKNSKNLIATCRFARIGTGSVIVDVRPYLEDYVPADLMMFWTKPAKGAVAAFAIIGIPDERAPVVRDNINIRETQPVVMANFYSEPTPDGLYNYKLVLPTGPINGINISVARVSVKTVGMTLIKKTRKCAKRKRGKCVKRKSERLFWFTKPACPASKQLSFQAFYGYATEPDQFVTRTIPCPDFTP